MAAQNIQVARRSLEGRKSAMQYNYGSEDKCSELSVSSWGAFGQQREGSTSG
jgi:hypothetical protein